MTARDGEDAVFQVVEAIFVAVLVATALIFFALVQKPTPSPQGAGLDLARVAGDSLQVLEGSGFEDALDPLLDTAAPTAAQVTAVRDLVAGTLPEGLRFLVRVTAFTSTSTATYSVYGPTDVQVDPRNAQGAVTYVIDPDADGSDAAEDLVLVELVVWNAF